MAKGKGRRRRSSALGDHQRHKKVLTPPFLQLPNLKQVSWHDNLPDFIWIQAIRDETGDLAATHGVLDALDPFVPTPSPQADISPRLDANPDPRDGARPPHPLEYLDGRISSFLLVPEERRADAREALRDQAPWGLPDQLGHGLCLYDDCPARWLFADWEAENDADAEIGTSYLKRLVAPILDPRGRPSSQIRMIPVARGFKHGKIFLTRGMEVTELLAKYPVGLNEEDQLHVEQWNRNMSNMQLMTSDRTVVDQWVRDFWRQNWRISTCDPEPIGTARLEENGTEDDLPERGAGRGRQPRTIGELQREFTSAVNTLGNELRNYQHQIEINIHDPVADEVKLGLASRMFRLLRHFAADADLWTNELGPHVLRSMIDARIIVGWLIIQDDPEQFQRFKDYGLGKRKLYKLQLEELMDRDDLSSDPDDQYLHKRLHAEFNQDVMEEFVKVDVGGSFSGKNIREMARDAGLGELYSLSYQPLSTEAHGEWSSLVGLDLRHCGNPLHRYHRLGTFGTAPEVFVHLGWVRNAFELAEAAITQIFQSYGVAVGPLFDRCLAQLDAARLDTGPDTGPEPTTG